MILSSFFKALSQIGDPAFRRVLWRGLGLTVLLLAAVTALISWGGGWLIGDRVNLWLIGEVSWVDDLFSWGFIVMMIVLSVFLMVPVAAAFVSMFLDSVADAVEKRHYPALPPAKGAPLGEEIRDGLSAFGLLVVANIGAVFLALVIPVGGFLIFYAVNGFLLGREYFTVAAMRREGRAGAAALRRRYRGRIWLAGALMAVPLSVPLLNLIVPILGAATFTHLYHGIAAKSRD